MQKTKPLLAHYRRAAGKTIMDAAKYLGVKKTMISRWENGHHYPTLERLPMLEAFYGAPIQYLYPEVFK